MVRIPRGSASGGPPGDRMIYRPVPARVLLGVSAACSAWAVADLVVSGRLVTGLLAASWLTAAVAALGCLFWRPAVIVDDAGVELRNAVRDVWVPWSRLEDVTTRHTLTLHAGGRRHASWAGAAPGRPSVAHRLPDDRWTPGGATPPTASRDLRSDSGATAFMVERGWRAWRERHPGGRAGSGDVGSGDVGSGDVGSGDVGSGDVGSGDAEPGRPAQVEVRWRPALPGFAAGSALVAMVLTLVLA